MKHEVEFIESGSWKRRITVEDGEITDRERYDENMEMFIEANCSCGKEFLDADEAWAHIKGLKE